MKLNIEELVRQTFTKQYADELIMFQAGAIENLAELIVERCAQEADDLAGHLLSFRDRKGADIAVSIRDGIRNLMEA